MPLLLPLSLAVEADTAALAQALAPLLRRGDALLLSGPVGAGKSAFARALLRARLRDPDLDVPSPTFTLVQAYEGPDGVPLWHADLYRLRGAEEARELGLVEAFEAAICLVEWPDRLGPLRPPGALRLDLQPEGEGRLAVISGPAAWAPRLEALRA